MATDLPAELQLIGEQSQQRLLGLARDLKSSGAKDDWALLVGAGMSAGSGVPEWKSFIVEAGQHFGVPVGDVDEDNYPLAAEQCLRIAQPPEEFWKFAEQRFCVERESARVHELVMQLPFQLYMTTNFDCLLDEAHSKVCRAQPSRLVYPALPSNKANDRRLAYLHGRCYCTSNAGERLSAGSIVFTQSAYDAAYRHDHQALPRFLYEVFSSMRVLVVGSSLADFPLRHILRELRAFNQEQSNNGSEPPKRHLAIVGTDKTASEATDLSFKGHGYGIDPIFYSKGERHEAFGAILEWLAKAVPPASSMEVR